MLISTFRIYYTFTTLSAIITINMHMIIFAIVKSIRTWMMLQLMLNAVNEYRTAFLKYKR